MRGGVQLSGEWIEGQPFDGTTTAGWYLDASSIASQCVRSRPWHGSSGSITTQTRLLMFTGDGKRSGHASGSARVFSAQVNVLHQTGQPDEYGPAAVDVGVTYSVRMRLH